MKYYNDVKAFHDKFGMVTPPSFFQIPTDLYEFRAKFFEEELAEYVESFETLDLPTAIDSLIDLVYITCGTALLHGIGPDAFASPRDMSAAYFPRGLDPKTPGLLPLDEHHNLKGAILNAMNFYRGSYVRANEIGIRHALNDLYWSCFYGAAKMGFNLKRWDMLWDDVQRANMSKERAVRADQSKRGSTHDVFKPVGWIAPRSEELVAMMLKGEA